MVLAFFFEYFDRTFAALPVGAISTERFPKTGKEFTRVEIRVVFPVPAYPLSIKMLLFPIVATKSDMSVIIWFCLVVGSKGKYSLNFSCSFLLFI